MPQKCQTNKVAMTFATKFEKQKDLQYNIKFETC